MTKTLQQAAAEVCHFIFQGFVLQDTVTPCLSCSGETCFASTIKLWCIWRHSLDALGQRPELDQAFICALSRHQSFCFVYLLWNLFARGTVSVVFAFQRWRTSSAMSLDRVSGSIGMTHLGKATPNLWGNRHFSCNQLRSWVSVRLQGQNC